MNRLFKILIMFLKAKIVFKNPKNCSLVIFDGASMDDLKNVLEEFVKSFN